MELRHLRYFVVVAEELNFSRATLRLRIAQPPLSAQIRRLEEDLGVQLFYRVKKRIELSPAGEVLLSEGRALLREADQVADRVRKAEAGQIGSLSIGFVATAMYDVLPGALGIFRCKYPKVRLNLEDMTSSQQVEALHGRKIDVGFVRPPVEESLFGTEKIVTETLMVALPDKHRLRERDQLALVDLAEEPFLACPSKAEPGLYELCRQLVREAGFQPRIVQEATHLQTLIGLVAAGVGICLVPSSATRMRRPGVIYRAISVPRVNIDKLMIWRKEPHPAYLAAFLEIVRQEASLLRATEQARRTDSAARGAAQQPGPTVLPNETNEQSPALSHRAVAVPDNLAGIPTYRDL
jgi:DNA-binding transcriptional LysR family regulator